MSLSRSRWQSIVVLGCKVERSEHAWSIARLVCQSNPFVQRLKYPLMDPSADQGLDLVPHEAGEVGERWRGVADREQSHGGRSCSDEFADSCRDLLS